MVTVYMCSSGAPTSMTRQVGTRTRTEWFPVCLALSVCLLWWWWWWWCVCVCVWGVFIFLFLFFVFLNYLPLNLVDTAQPSLIESVPRPLETTRRDRRPKSVCKLCLVQIIFCTFFSVFGSCFTENASSHRVFVSRWGVSSQFSSLLFLSVSFLHTAQTATN